MAFKLFTNKFKWFNSLALAISLAVASGTCLAQGKLYRYVNDQGTKVISSSIPPKYVSRGYEILSPNGRVMQVIEPEPEPEDKERVEREKALLAEYELLARRYSAITDIEAARERKLGRLDANIAILRGNISNLTSQIEDHMSSAASYERSGKKVPAHIFNSIDELRAEVKSTEQVLRLRLAEHKEIHNSFDADIELFKKGKELEKQSQTAQFP